MNALSADKREQSGESDSAVASFALHTCLAMILGSILMVITGAIVDYILGNSSPSLKSVVDRAGLLSPFLWVPGIVLGFLLNRRTSMRTACWVWIVGISWLGAGVWDSIHYYDPRYYQGCSILENLVNALFILNARRCGGGDSTLAGLFFTMPAINSATYSVGAWAAIGLKKTRSGPP
jgi:hypothetical protein